MRWYPKNLAATDPTTRRTATLLIVFSLVTTVSSSAFIPTFYYLIGLSSAVYIAVVTLIMGITTLVIRVTGSITFTGHYFLFSLWLLITGVTLLLGGVKSPGLPAFCIIPLGATFLLGTRAGTIWTLLCIAGVVSAHVAQGHWITPPDVPAERMSLVTLLALIADFSVICFFSILYDRAKNNALGELGNANARTLKMITQLEEASERLAFSSEQFLGSGIEGDQHGLVSQMMGKAREGRNSIEHSREQINGMIAQYRRISMLVKNLHEQSQVILELVSTIGRISDRLDLLALNVSIEAAHSGGIGKQFLTLAGDIRRLAERVMMETTRIKTALRRVHAQVQEVLESSASGQELTEASIKSMTSMASTFDHIYDLIEQTEGATGQITADTLAQIEAVRKLITVVHET